MIIHATGRGPVQLGHLGSVQDVLVGILPENLSHETFQAADYLYGFELASPRDCHSLGEAVLVNGLCYATSTDAKSSDYHRTIHGPRFVTGGMLLFPHGIEPGFVATFQAQNSHLSMSDFYREVYKVTRQPTAIVGLFDYAHLHGNAIGMPPIDGRAIFDHRTEFFPHAEVQETNVPALVMSVITDFSDPRSRELNARLEVVLYNNPLDSESSLSSHAHALTLKSPMVHISGIRPDQANLVLHLLVSGTCIRSLSASIFTLSDVVDARQWMEGRTHRWKTNAGPPGCSSNASNGTE